MTGDGCRDRDGDDIGATAGPDVDDGSAVDRVAPEAAAGLRPRGRLVEPDLGRLERARLDHRQRRVGPGPPRQVEGEQALRGRRVADRGEDGALAVGDARQVLVDGRGGSPPRGDGVDDRLRPGHDVAAGEDAGPARGERPRVGHDAGPAADLDARALGEDGRIGLLADGDEDRRGRELLVGAGDRLPGCSPVVARAGGRSGLDAADAGDRAVAAHDLDRGKTGPHDDPLALGRLDLLDLGRHLRATAPIDDGDRGSAAAPGRSRGIHRGAAAADDHGRTVQARLLAEVDPLEEERGRDDPRGVVTGDAEPPTLRGAGREEDGSIALLLEVAEGEVATHRGVQPEVHAQTDDPGDLGLEDVARQPVRRDADGHHPARDRHRLEHRDRIAQPGEVVRRGHARRPAAHDPDLLGPPDRRGVDRRQMAVLGGEALERADRDRFVEHAPAAGGLARGGADPAAHRRERIDLRGDRVRLVVPLRPDEPDVPAGVRAGRTGDLAGRQGDGGPTLLHRAPDLPRLGPLGRLPAQQVAPRRRVVALEDLAGHAPERQPRLGAAGGRRTLDRTLARRQRRLARFGHEGHDDDRALADADAAADALADLDRVLHHPGLWTAESGGFDAGPPWGRDMSRASTGQVSMQMPQLMQPVWSMSMR